MKKILTKILIVLIVFTIAIQYTIPIMSFANTKKINKYLALGDSIAFGYGLENRNTDSYASKIKKYCNIDDNNYQNLAVSGMTCQEFYQKIQTKKYTDSIKNTDFITVSIGSNELLGLVINIASEVTGIKSENNPNFTKEVQEYILKLGLGEKINLLQKFYNTLTSEENKQKIEAAILSYSKYWKESVNYIKEKNPNVIIVATEFYNPYYEVALASYDMGGFVDEYIKKMNTILWEQSDSQKNYKIAKIYNAFNKTNPRLTNVNVSISDINKFNIDPHPNVLGHEMIATKIKDVLTDINKSSKINIATLQINSINDYKYTSKEIKPEINIKNGQSKLEEGKDYTVSYYNNINVGQAKIIITGIGDYEGTVIKTFNITKVDERKELSDLKINDISDQTYIGIAIEPEIEIYDGNNKLVKNVDYTIQCQDNIDTGNAIIIINGVGNYKGIIKKTFKIIAKDIQYVSISEIKDQEYTSKEIEPKLEIADGSIKLQQNKDYKVNYENNVNEGQAKVTITGIKNYTGKVTKTFNIFKDSNQETKKDISKLQITQIEEKIYTGKLITPEVRILDNNNVLIKDKDYTINYINNLNIGTGKAIIVGIGNYIGKIELEFKIIEKDINYTDIIDIKDQQYTGKEITPEVKIVSDGIILKENTDYIVEYKDNLNIGVATINIVGKGNYTGTATITFNIIENNDKQENNNKWEQNDNTIINKIFPKTGDLKEYLKIVMGFVFLSVIVLYVLYKKYNIKLK